MRPPKRRSKLAKAFWRTIPIYKASSPGYILAFANDVWMGTPKSDRNLKGREKGITVEDKDDAEYSACYDADILL